MSSEALKRASSILNGEKNVYMMGEKGLMESLASSHAMRGVMGVVLISTSANVMSAALQKNDNGKLNEPTAVTAKSEQRNLKDILGKNVLDHGNGDYTLIAAKQIPFDQEQELDSISYIQNKMQETGVADSIFVMDDVKYQKAHTFPEELDLSSSEAFLNTVKYDADLLRKDMMEKGVDLAVGVYANDRADEHADRMYARGLGAGYQGPTAYATLIQGASENTCLLAPTVNAYTLEQHLMASRITDGSVDFKVPQNVSEYSEKMVINEELSHCVDYLVNGEEIGALASQEDAKLFLSMRVERFGQLSSALEMAKDFKNTEVAHFLNNRLKLNTLDGHEMSLSHEVGTLFDEALPEIEAMMKDGTLDSMTREARDAWVLEKTHKSMEGLTPEIVNQHQELIDNFVKNFEGLSTKQKHEKLKTMEIPEEIQGYVNRFSEAYGEIVVEKEADLEISARDIRNSVAESYTEYLTREAAERSTDPSLVGHFYNREYRALQAEQAKVSETFSSIGQQAMERDEDGNFSLNPAFDGDRAAVRQSILEYSTKIRTLESAYAKHMQKHPELTAERSAEMPLEQNVEMEKSL